jgi:hypothetical protein
MVPNPKTAATVLDERPLPATLACQAADAAPHSRGAFRPSFASSLHPLEPRGRREGRVLTSHPRSAARRCSAKEPHSSIQVVPITRPSLRDGRTAYAVLSREPNFPSGLPHPANCQCRLPGWARAHLRKRLDRSNDGQDHTVLPYARPAISPQFSRPRRRSRKLTDETNLTAPLVRMRPRAHRDYPPCPHLSCRRCRVHRKPGSQSRRQRDRPSRLSRDGQDIR